MNAGNPAVLADAHAHEDIAAEGLDQGSTFIAYPERRPIGSDLSRRQTAQKL